MHVFHSSDEAGLPALSGRRSLVHAILHAFPRHFSFCATSACVTRVTVPRCTAPSVTHAMLRLPEVPPSRRSGGPQPHHSPTGKSFTPDWSRSIVDSQSGCAGFMASLVPKALAPARTLFQKTDGGTRVQIGSGAERTEIALRAQSTANKQETKPTTDNAT